MHPQEIVEEEELERMKALLQRENLIRSLGIVEQLTRMLHPSHQGQKKLHEYRVRVPAQPLTEQGKEGCSSTWWWPQHRRLMDGIWHGAWESRVCWVLGKGLLVPFAFVPKLPCL